MGIASSLFKDFIYLLRESERAGGGADGEGTTESQADSALNSKPTLGAQSHHPEILTLAKIRVPRLTD